MANLVENYDVVIVGAGHAGCEAALASARLGLNTIVFTVSVDSIALMPLIKHLFSQKCSINLKVRQFILCVLRLTSRIIHVKCVKH